MLASRRVQVVVGFVMLVGILALTALVWYIFFRPAGPPPIGPGAPSIPEAVLTWPALAVVSTLIPG